MPPAVAEILMLEVTVRDAKLALGQVIPPFAALILTLALAAFNARVVKSAFGQVMPPEFIVKPVVLL